VLQNFALAEPSLRGVDMLKKTVLVVEDEEDIRELVSYHLLKEGYQVAGVASGEEALATAEARPPDLILLDLMLPGVDGLTVCQRLRKNPRTESVPIVMLTAKGEESDIVGGLNLGANDYVTKPFSPKELVARVRAVLRRTESAAMPAEVVRVGDLELDLPRRRTTVAGHRVELTPTEFEVLTTLAREPGRVFTRAQLLDAVHGVAFESYERAIDAHVKNIRRKIEDDPRDPRRLQTVFGVGYRVADEAP
jgi:DNA-binding response OmpR family regulator